ncbi:cyclic nucleotide-binding domain-containing protein [Streptomyces sp. RM72]|uniref:cyclic nucleotide-binding domain-containing protein n=1 Tax=Streptomyces sp. RM72 TaxID=1115510 RepID=UPI001B39C7FF|nr:cyclic nucleotide-binding domain-containing protein [Streptomyces sp. RM72]MBQ0890654.1 cyclic nucleotide-binding domain-containing protein [Streptomyces sp. RM72]
MTSTTTLPIAMPAQHRERLLRLAREVSFPSGARLFEEGRPADRFWVIRTGMVVLDIRVPDGRNAVVESLGHGELLGWSWHFPPYQWHLGAEALSPVRAWEFDAKTVLTVGAEHPEFGRAVATWVGQVVADRLQKTRIRLLDLYAPHGSGILP